VACTLFFQTMLAMWELRAAFIYRVIQLFMLVYSDSAASCFAQIAIVDCSGRFKDSLTSYLNRSAVRDRLVVRQKAIAKLK